jgi:iron complex transport system ATP-binding protein
MLHVDHLAVGYNGINVVKDINLRLGRGEVTVLIGPNGCGKSTLLRSIAGMLPRQGEVYLDPESDGKKISADMQFAYMPQDSYTASSLTVLEVVLLGRLQSLGLRVPVAMIEGAREALRNFNLLHLQSRGLSELSGGQRQIVYLVQALFRETSVLLLDEPTGALDLYYQLAVLEAVKEYTQRSNVVTIMALHDLTLAMRYASRIVCLHGGGIVADGSPKEVLSRDLVQAVYRVDADVIDTQDGFRCVIPTGSLRQELAGM